MSQAEKIRAHLEDGHDLTPIDALHLYGCFRLAARIDELRQSGMSIETITERRNGKAYARYRLHRPEQQDMFRYERVISGTGNSAERKELAALIRGLS